jgi:hypothetical protein
VAEAGMTFELGCEQIPAHARLKGGERRPGPRSVGQALGSLPTGHGWEVPDRIAQGHGLGLRLGPGEHTTVAQGAEDEARAMLRDTVAEESTIRASTA